MIVQFSCFREYLMPPSLWVSKSLIRSKVSRIVAMLALDLHDVHFQALIESFTQSREELPISYTATTFPTVAKLQYSRSTIVKV